jgi:hypothetical protein
MPHAMRFVHLPAHPIADSFEASQRIGRKILSHAALFHSHAIRSRSIFSFHWVCVACCRALRIDAPPADGGRSIVLVPQWMILIASRPSRATDSPAHFQGSQVKAIFA